MRITRGTGLALLLFGVWSWLLWPTFLTNILRSENSWSGGSPTGFLWVHLAIGAVSLVLGTAIGVLGWRGYRAAGRGD
ncbi:SCO4848 family membrane protein [Actinopolyspora mortivallis]|uniref:Integral membrane protein n=1 Tax=Actinopolyspora mortivallis TaxID=33906 RepID=A0A2T0GXG1_ACTMO|nr:hypothetical protein [Actinopolyspora mortivallis]PRW63799.1 hypothetical protein CEP50_08420 [Actinopolyspora mortivallis]